MQTSSKNLRDQNSLRNNNYTRGTAFRETTPRHVFQDSSVIAKMAGKTRANETIEDIREDIARIEKEIQLEIKEIKSMRLGL